MADKQPSVLVVDDLPDWRTTLRGLLEEEGYNVQVAGTLAEAQALLAASPFDLAVLDACLDNSDETNTDGITLAGEIKSHWPAAKVIIITGYETSETIQRVMEPDARGQRLAADFVPKTETEKLTRAVLKVLAQ